MERNLRKERVGLVVSDKMDKNRRRGNHRQEQTPSVQKDDRHVETPESAR